VQEKSGEKRILFERSEFIRDLIFFKRLSVLRCKRSGFSGRISLVPFLWAIKEMNKIVCGREAGI